MPTKVKHRSAPSRARHNFIRRKSKTKLRRKVDRQPSAPAPKIVADSVFTLGLKPKSYGAIGSPDGKKQEGVNMMKQDLQRAYNHAADLVGKERIKSADANVLNSLVDILAHFKKNICPEGFEVNIDEHHNKKANRIGYHFTLFKACEFPAGYWHFFDIKNLVTDLGRSNKKLHDFFVSFLKSFIQYCNIPTWYDNEMSDAQFILANYLDELRDCIKRGVPDDVYQRTGYTPEQMLKRKTDIERTLMDYATGSAAHFEQLLKKTKVRTPGSLLRSLKSFPPQNKLVQFMKQACEVMKCNIGVGDFNYNIGQGKHNGEMVFSQQVTIVWDWSDHYSATYGNSLIDIAKYVGVFPPTIAGHFLPIGCGGLKMKNLTENLDFPKKISALQGNFQKITERYTKYENSRNLI